MRKIIVVFISIYMSLMLCSCWIQTNSETPLSSADSSQCISPPITFAYPINGIRSSEQLEQVLPLPPWEMETSLPETIDSEIYRYRDFIAMVRTHGGRDEIWVIRRLSSLVDTSSKKVETELWIYYSNSHEWVEIPTGIYGSDAVVVDLHLDTNGMIWAEGAVDKSTGGPPSEIFIAIFNQEENRFELVEDLINIQGANLAFDPRGYFWILKYHDGIYRFDPSSRKYQKLIAITDLEAMSVAFAPDGSLYISQFNAELAEPISSAWLLHYIPSTGELIRINVKLQPLERDYGLFVDSSGRLWLNDYGWLEPDGTWYQVVRSPIFITDTVEDSPRYTWPSAWLDLESSDGRLWFGSSTGKAWLDPQNGEWCWFTTENVSIVEDQSHTLWTLVEEHLYKLPLVP